jgi:lambda family phage portal protein
MSGYSESGGNVSKPSMRGWTDVSLDAAADIGANLGTLRRRARSLYQNTPLARGAVERPIIYAGGVGLWPTFLPDWDTLGITREAAKAWGKMVEDRFFAWAESPMCDAAGLLNLYEQQRLVGVSWLASGDVFCALKLRRGEDGLPALCLATIEADQCATPPERTSDVRVVDGVETDASGLVVAYWLANRHPLARRGEPLTYSRVPVTGAASGRRNVLQVFRAERPGYYRGVPLLAVAIESFRQLDQYTRAEILAALNSTIFTAAVYRQVADGMLGALADGEPATDGGTAATGVGADGISEIRLGAGNLLELEDGERLEAIQSNRPSGTYGPFAKEILKGVGGGIGTPVEALQLSYESSYSASRASNLAFEKLVDLTRDTLLERHSAPIAREWLTLEVLAGRIPAPGYVDSPIARRAWQRAEWHGPAFGQIDPLKEIMAAKERIALGISSRRIECAALTGRDLDTVLDELAEENARLGEIAPADVAATAAMLSALRDE